MSCLKVNTKTRSYDVINQAGALENIGEYISKARGASSVLVVTDETVQDLYLGKVCASLNKSGFKSVSFAFPAGEKSKTAKTYLQIIDALAWSHFTREDLVLALGGGVVGDIAGFAAATYMRGIDVVQAPTTLLAAIDSAIGGKTGVDLEEGKNLLGAFHQPRLVLFDSDTLKTLSDADLKNGLGEGFKYAVLEGGRILQIMLEGVCEKNTDEFVALCQGVKASIVEDDEKESGRRKLLNLGHTLGHAVEKLSGFEIPHGEAVAQGILAMSEAALAAGELSGTDYRIICSVAHKYGFEKNNVFTYEDMLKAACSDKKLSKDNRIAFVKIKGIGNCAIEKAAFSQFEAYVKGANTLTLQKPCGNFES
jgi:3-dehydroquinate synthase